jgi:PHD/YefM family antitoxin component YafN of YafNO toxin-antitoxin module
MTTNMEGINMSELSIRPSRDIRTNYAEISELCKQHPVAITVNGREDTVVMSHEQYMEQQNRIEELEACIRFYTELARSEEDKQEGRYRSIDDAFEQLREKLKSRKK